MIDAVTMVATRPRKRGHPLVFSDQVSDVRDCSGTRQMFRLWDQSTIRAGETGMSKAADRKQIAAIRRKSREQYPNLIRAHCHHFALPPEARASVIRATPI